ncbi:MAG: energy-coupling factor transporter transmembrane protein EcfT [Azoarcus sp.]|jgi:energy-coupling factor transporter transmembrane protein EcfT|nr:energy-coupling factor transporter transmembrane protein EcfT [Azoarcus sp.]
MHAGLILFLWAVAAVFMQQAEGWVLAVSLVLSLSVALVCARTYCLRLLVRVRVLLLAIFVLFALFTPGEVVFPDGLRISPSKEGLLLALTHASRLLALVCWVAVLLGRMPTERLVSGLYALFRPCAVFGLSAERAALRLLLVLRYANVTQRGKQPWRDWKGWLDPPVAVAGFESIRLTREHLGFRDIALLVTAFALLVFWWSR